MSADSFSLSVGISIRTTYGNRCVLCLHNLPPGGAHSAHLIDQSSTTGTEQLVEVQHLGLLPADFRRNSIDNGILLCPSCHLSYFTTNIISFSPPLPVLQYINDYLNQTPVADQLPLHELFTLLRSGDIDDLPDPSQILDYLDLYVVVPLRSESLQRQQIHTYAQPQPFIFDPGDNIFRCGAGDPTNPDIVHIFMPVHIAERDDDPADGPTLRLLSHNPRLYWQLPIETEIVLAMIVVRRFDTADVCDEIDLIEEIRTSLQRRATAVRRSRRGGHAGAGGGVGAASGAGGGGAGAGGGRRGRSGRSGAGAGGRALRVHGGAGDLKSTPREPQHKKARRKPSLKFLTREVEDASDRSLSQQKPYGVHPETWDVASTFTTLVDEKPERPSSHFGSSVPSLPEADQNDDPSTWNFGPSFSSDMIIDAARRMTRI